MWWVKAWDTENSPTGSNVRYFGGFRHLEYAERCLANLAIGDTCNRAQIIFLANDRVPWEDA